MTQPAAPARIGMDEEVFTFSSGGCLLPAVLTRPEAGVAPPAGAAGLGVLLLSPGLKHRVGPHRLHLKLAHRFARLGLPVLRFDFHGTGDAEGELPMDDVPELHERIQLGLFTQDTLDALAAFADRAGVTRVLACGLCGGAITAVYAAAADPRFSAIIGFQLPVKVMDRSAEFADQISPEFSDFILGLYLKKLFSPAAWRNFLGGRSEYKLIWKTAARRLRRRFTREKARVAAAPPIPPGMNRPFLDAYHAIAGRVRMQWIYSEQERARYDFEEDFEQRCLQGRERPYEKVIIPESNHEFAPDAAQAALLAHIEGWLIRQYGVEGGA
jgi:pimeloyl-ACP methyl ester carboxylesterase